MINFEDMVRALAKPGEKIAAEITGLDAHLLHMIVGISGESGELLDAIKKPATSWTANPWVWVVEFKRVLP